MMMPMHGESRVALLDICKAFDKVWHPTQNEKATNVQILISYLISTLRNRGYLKEAYKARYYTNSTRLASLQQNSQPEIPIHKSRSYH